MNYEYLIDQVERMRAWQKTKEKLKHLHPTDYKRLRKLENEVDRIVYENKKQKKPIPC